MVPQQALFGMNSEFVVEQARALAARPEVAGAADTPARIRSLYRLVFAREPESSELAAAAQFLEMPQPSERLLPSAWLYGYGEFDLETHQVRSFTALPHFQDGMWRGSHQLPDPKLGWVMLSAQGGHPGGNLKLTVIRRWRAKRSGMAKITALLEHGAEMGDGVRGHVVSGRRGQIAEWTVHHGQVETNLDEIPMEEGETLDFVVDCLSHEAHDSFAWAPRIELMPSDGKSAMRYDAAIDFRGPQSVQRKLSPLEQFAQALLLTNEFVFVD
jgi:hypothetical protein